MKKVIIALCAAIMLMAATVLAFDAPNGAPYGVTADGVYFISADLVKAANGSAPKAMFNAGKPDWVREPMKLDGNYYIYASGKKFRASGEKEEFCFDIGNNQYIPHAALGDSRIKAGDLKLNPWGYPNFYVAPAK